LHCLVFYLAGRLERIVFGDIAHALYLSCGGGWMMWQMLARRTRGPSCSVVTAALDLIIFLPRKPSAVISSNETSNTDHSFLANTVAFGRRVTVDETAHFLAGMPVTGALEPLTRSSITRQWTGVAKKQQLQIAPSAIG
jgi:hypothetical protein